MEFDKDTYLKRQSVKDKKRHEHHRTTKKLENQLEWNYPERSRYDTLEEYEDALKRFNDSIDSFNAILKRYNNLALSTVHYSNIKDKLIEHSIKEIIEDELDPDIIILTRR